MPINPSNCWFWFTLALLLIGLEMLLPGILLLWFGIGALLTGFSLLIFQGLAIKYLIVIFAVFSFLSILLSKKYFSSLADKKNGLNDISERYTGKIVKASGNFENGNGKVLLGDTVWQATSKDMVNDGEALRVVSVNDLVLVVEQLKNSSV